MKSVLLYIPLLFLIFSCNTFEEDIFQGRWNFDPSTLKMNDEYSLRYTGFFEFEEGKCTVPINLNSRIDQNNNNKGSWSCSVRNDKLFLNLKTGSEVFTGEYAISFRKDLKKNRLTMVMRKDSIYAECFKMYYNIEKHGAYIDNIINQYGE